MENQLQVINYKEQRVLTTKQLAESYGTEPVRIQQNFSENKERFKEGIHYFIVKYGDPCYSFITNNSSVRRSQYLWTEKGCLNHAKILETDTAWNVYDVLVDTYFKYKELKQTPDFKFFSKKQRRNLTDSLKVSGEDERMHGYGYSNYTDLIYQAVFGKPASQIRKEKGLGKNANLRKFMTPEELIKAAELENKTAFMIEDGKSYYFIKGCLLNDMENAMLEEKKSQERKRLKEEKRLMIEEKDDDNDDLPF